MEIRNNNGLIEALIAQRLGTQSGLAKRTTATSATAQPQTDLISVSRDLVISTSASPTNGQSVLTKDVIETIDKGFRRTQNFERTDGRPFTRVEEFTVSERNARRIVVQQNASGSTTHLDEVFERQDDGLFRQTSRYTDESGETSTQIKTDLSLIDPFILSGGKIPPPEGRGTLGPFTPYQNSRGTQLDLQA